MARKLVRMVTYFEGFLTIKSHNALITWSCKVTWETEIIISLLPERLWPRSRGKLVKPPYLYYKSVYGNQTWQNDSFPWWALTYNVAWPFDHMALWDTRFTYRRRFSTQTLKSSPSSCIFLFFSFSSLFLNRLAKVLLRRNYCVVIHDTCDQNWTSSFSFCPSQQDFGRSALSFLANVLL